MDDLLMLILALFVILAIIAAVVLPIVALVISIRSKKKLAERISRLEAGLSHGVPDAPMIQSATSFAALVQQLTTRVARLESVLTASNIPMPGAFDELSKAATDPTLPRSASVPAPVVDQRPPATVVESMPLDPKELRPSATSASLFTRPIQTIPAEQLESIIGRRWLGWAAVGLILFATAFFLKYAFDNRWIGELGRVAIGVATGVALTAFGLKYHKRGWRVFSRILTAGGIVLLYLSDYAAFGYYHLATQKAAFAYLAILVAEAAGLALLYDAPAIAIMALIGGFLAPVLLRSDRDQYRSLFGYIAALDVGALALLKHWMGLSSVAFAGTHLLFWLWYGDNYHPRKLVAVLVFQTSVFLIFLLAHLGRQLVKRQPAASEDLSLNPFVFFARFEDLGLLLLNPFVFFATAYHFLDTEHHDWMGVFAIVMALLYAGATRALLSRSAANRTQALVMIGVALTFVTLAIPIQLRSNWITIAWSVEALAILWAGIETKAWQLRVGAFALFALSLVRLVLWDTPFDSRPPFTPVLNKYFLSSLVVTICLFAAAVLSRRLGARKKISVPAVSLVILLVAIVTLWFVMSVETNTFFEARASAQKLGEDASRERWLGQMSLSVLWSVYAGVLTALGFLRRSASVRWAALALFGLTIIKVTLVDIAQLQQLYRIIAFFVLGMLLLLVAWGYHKAFHSREAPK
jgi:uncharacterized membrane protein